MQSGPAELWQMQHAPPLLLKHKGEPSREEEATEEGEREGEPRPGGTEVRREWNDWGWRKFNVKGEEKVKGKNEFGHDIKADHAGEVISPSTWLEGSSTERESGGEIDIRGVENLKMWGYEFKTCI